MSGSESYDELIGRPEADVRLAHAALVWAKDEYADLNPEDYLDRLNALADRVDQRNAGDDLERVEALRHVIAEDEAYRGNVDDITSPDNCYLNRTMDTRLGMPLSLGIIWIDAAQQLGWPISGMAMPGHFVLRYGHNGEDVFIDPFNGGRTISRDDCVTVLRTLFGSDYEPVEEHFAPISSRAVLARMIANTYAIYVAADDWTRTVQTLKRLVALDPEDALLHAELGRAQIKTDDLAGASATLKRALELASGAEEKSTVNHHFVELRNRLKSAG